MRILHMALAAFTATLFAASASLAGEQNATNTSASGSAAGASVYMNSKSYRGTGAAIAPGLAVSAFSCQGSVSGGAGGAGWGFSFGSTVMDKDCNTRENAKMAASAFGVGVGRAVLCEIDQIRRNAPQCGGGRVATRPAGRPVRGQVVASSGGGWGQRSN